MKSEENTKCIVLGCCAFFALKENGKIRINIFLFMDIHQVFPESESVYNRIELYLSDGFGYSASMYVYIKYIMCYKFHSKNILEISVAKKREGKFFNLSLRCLETSLWHMIFFFASAKVLIIV